MVLESVTLDHKELILSIFERSSDFFTRVEGCRPTLRTVEEALLGIPSTTCPKYRKEFLVIRCEGEPMGTVELHCHHPEEGIVYIGLLLLPQEYRGYGIGRKAYDAIERYLSERYACQRVLLGVSDDNDVSGFWSKLGFRANGKNYCWMGERKANNVVEYEKWLTRSFQELSL
ncbi:MAG: GNAT family N-acetyltransferase [Bdellovibrionales bacterium]